MGDLDANYDLKNLKPLIVGGPFNKEAEGDKCDVNNIANPDSVFVDGQGRLWIGEDSGYHVNNTLWMWDGKALHRFATVPVGAEVTGFYVTADDTIFFNAQHPSAMNPHPFNRGVVGVVNGFKASDAFEALPVPTGDQRYRVMVAAGEYQVLARVGESIPHDVYGQRFGQVSRLGGTLLGVCNHPDGNMFLPTNEKATEGYLYTNYECQPGAISKLYIRNNGKSWDVLEGENVDFSAVKGTWNN